jgi:hypothetical protein
MLRAKEIFPCAILGVYSIGLPTLVHAVVLYVQLCVYGPYQVPNYCVKHESAAFDSSPLIYLDLIWSVKHIVPLFMFPLAFPSLLGLDGFYLLQCVVFV